MTGHIEGRVADFIGLMFVGMLLAALSAPVAAQDSQGSYDRGTPPAAKAGRSSASTYSADKLEVVNLANGNLSMALPLATLGGRGSASYPVALSYNSKVWSAVNYPVTFWSEGRGYYTVEHYSAVYEDASMKAPNVVALGGGWSIQLGAAVKTHLVESDPVPYATCNHAVNNGGTDVRTCGFFHVLTKASLYLPDGSEVELRDALTNGAPARTTVVDPDGYRHSTDRDRGRVWQSTDGSNVTYVTDAANGVVTGQFAGWVFLGDGTRLRMDALGHCTRIEDRNGNYVEFNLNALFGSPAIMTDQLGRQVTVVVTGQGATVTVKGYGGVPDRVYQVNTGALGAADGGGVADNLREDFRGWQRPFATGDFSHGEENDFEHTFGAPHTDLFLRSEGNDYTDDKTVVTGLSLPDGRSFRFRYNPWGEVAEVVYPGGGVSQIDYAGSGGMMCPVGVFNELAATLNRQVSQRRLLPDGADVEAVWTYDYTAVSSYVGVEGATKVEAHQGGAGGPLLSSETHTFKMLNGAYIVCGVAWGTGDEKWQNAKEVSVERQTGTGTQVTTREWEQPAAPDWGNDVGLTYNDYKATHGMEVDLPNYPRVKWEETKLENGKVKRVEYGYDQFNNVTSVREYDFGTAGQPGDPLRHVVRKYAGGADSTAVNGYCYTTLNPLDPSCGPLPAGQAPDPDKIIHQRHLLLSEEVLDGHERRESYVEYEYDNYAADGDHEALAFNPGMVGNEGSRFAAFDPAHQPRGNVTRVSAWIEGIGSGATYAVSYSRYDNAGNVVSAKDPLGHVSTVSHADNFGGGDNPEAGAAGPAGPTFAFPTLVTNALGHQAKTQYDYARGVATGTKDPNGVVSKVEYDALGRPVRATTALGLAGQQAVAEMSYPTAGQNVAAASRQLDATRWVASKTEFDGFDRPVLSAAAEDGRKATDPAVNFTTFTKTVYDPLGRVKLTTAPYRAQAAPTDSWARASYDLAGRVTEVATFAGGVSSPPPDAGTGAAWTGSVVTTYDGERTTVRDQANKQRRSAADALGRLASVDEMYEYPSTSVYATTTYKYDARGNLREVHQDQQTRAFAYDGLSRLILARNPEQDATLTDARASGDWSLKYAYDAAGNLEQRTDARGVVSTYLYDDLNRNTSVTYAGGAGATTPAVTRTYDGATLGKGRLWKSETAQTALTTVEEYDAAGRPLRQGQQFWTGAGWGTPYTVQHAYDLAGDLLSQTYPSGRSVGYQYDAAGRLYDFSGNLGDWAQRTYSTGMTYDGAGRMTQERFGTDTPVYNKHLFNSRGQLAEIRVSTYGLSSPGQETNWNRGAIINHYSDSGWGATGGGPDNNGNLRRQDIFIPKIEGSNYDQGGNFEVFSQSFDYDWLNRLTRAAESWAGQTRWAQAYDYDRWGNRTINADGTWLGPLQPAPAPTPAPSDLVNEKQFDVTELPNTNRLYAPGDPARVPDERLMQYDAAGNLTVDKYTGKGARAYDAENRMTSAQFFSGQAQTASYVYDADGRRVKRNVGSSDEVWQVYGVGGELLAEYAPGADPARPLKEYGYRAGELLVTAESPATAGSAPRLNVARASNGGVASASSSLNSPPWVFTPSGANDGDRKGANWGSGGGWNDATGGAFPDWYQVEFAAAMTIDEVDVFTGQDAYASPSEPTESMTFTQYGLTAFQVQYWDGGAWVTVPNGGVTGNNKVWRKLTFPAVTTTKVRVLMQASADGYSRLAEVEAWGTPATRSNFALASNGGVASASSSLNSPPWVFTPSGANDGDRRGLNWGSGGGWNDDAPGNNFPDWLQVEFPGPKSIDEVDVFTGQDAYANPAEPTESQTFTLYGLTSYEVQYWDGSGWVTAPGGSVSGNDRVWRRFTFPAVTTSKVRVLTQSSVDGYSRLTELEAWGGGAAVAAQGADVRWLVADQLGTPRMVVDKTGSLAGVTRHDYLPFGEELAGVGGRATTQGYGAADNLRQQFTGYERDNESGLDYAQARYYASGQGRFTSVDPLLTSARTGVPQSWNRYAYSLNRPLTYTDPSGMDPQTGGKYECKVRPQCTGPAFVEDGGTIVATPDVLPVTRLEINTGLSNPIPEQPLPLTSAVLGPLTSSGEGGALGAGVAVGTLGPASEASPVGLGIAAGVLGVFTIDLAHAAGKAIADAIPQPTERDSTIILWRGVPVGHPGYAAALQGMAIPLGGDATPEEHNMGNTHSIYTSWTKDPLLAPLIAGPGGVVLTKEFPLSRVVPSPDLFHEFEVLVPGVVTGAKVAIVP